MLFHNAEKQYRFFRRAAAFVMALLLCLSSVDLPVFAEGIPEGELDLPAVTDGGAPGAEENPLPEPTEEPAAPASAPFQQTVSVDEIRFVITAADGVITPGAKIAIERKADEEAEKPS